MDLEVENPGPIWAPRCKEGVVADELGMLWMEGIEVVGAIGWGLRIVLVKRLIKEAAFEALRELRADIKHPLTNFGGVWSGRGQPSREIFEPDWKLLPTPPNFEKTLPLHSWRPLDYKSHIERTSLSRPKSNIYVHFHWVNKQLTRISLSKWNRQ